MQIKQKGMKLNFLISVIVPVYNVSKYLRKCLVSLQKQSYTNMEILMVNDGSTDGSEKICYQFSQKDSRFLLFNKRNGGLSDARNYGLMRAKGDYICFVDSDDWVLSDFIASFVKAVEEADIVIARYILDDKQLKRRYIPFHSLNWKNSYSGEKKYEQIVEHLMFDGIKGNFEIRDTVMPVWKNMYRRKFLLDNNLKFITEREIYAEDYIFNMEAYCLAKEINVIDDAKIIHLINKGSLSQRYRENMFEMSKKSHFLAYDILKTYCGINCAEKLNQKIPEIISYSAFKEAQCNFRKARNNLENIYKDSFTQKMLKKKYTDFVSIKNRIIYGLIRKHRIMLLVLVIKIMSKLELPYRYMRMCLRK